MSNQNDEIDWSLTTWEGSRREQLRRWCKLSLRERLLAVEEMADLARHFADMRAQGRFRDLSKMPDDGATGVQKEEEKVDKLPVSGEKEPRHMSGIAVQEQHGDYNSKASTQTVSTENGSSGSGRGSREGDKKGGHEE